MRGDAPDPFADARKLLADGKPRLAIPILEKMRQTADAAIAEQASRMLAFAYFENKNYRAAAPFFQLEMQAGNDRDAAEWHYLLCLVADYPNQKQRVDKILGEIIKQDFPEDPANNHPFLGAAKELKTRLRQPEK